MPRIGQTPAPGPLKNIITPSGLRYRKEAAANSTAKALKKFDTPAKQEKAIAMATRKLDALEAQMAVADDGMKMVEKTAKTMLAMKDVFSLPLNQCVVEFKDRAAKLIMLQMLVILAPNEGLNAKQNAAEACHFAGPLKILDDIRQSLCGEKGVATPGGKTPITINNVNSSGRMSSGVLLGTDPPPPAIDDNMKEWREPEQG